MRRSGFVQHDFSIVRSPGISGDGGLARISGEQEGKDEPCE